MKLPPSARFKTRCIHAGQEPDPTTGAIIMPIYQTATYVQDELGKHKGFEYARTQNPTRSAVEANIAALEGGARGFAFASGMAAIDAVASLLAAGDHMVVTDNTYGGTFRLFERVLRRYGMEFTYVDSSDVALVAQAITPRTRMIFIETPTNPVMRLVDLRAVAQLARSRGVRLVVDNTFASPFNQRPLDLGAHLVVHSTTKYLNGHSDSVGGAVVSNDAEASEWLAFVQNAAGAILSPFDSWLVLRGTKTLAVRMTQHNQNAQVVAEYLGASAKVTRVFYPGLPSHPQHRLAVSQMHGFGGMLSFEAASFEAARQVLNGVRLFALAESLGGVESLICHPATMTHASVPADVRARLGITDSMVRLSVGIEDVQDLVDDLEQALARV
jgi:cystathionine gamma-lyase/cystathionine beta-lyase/cystathionine gamma-lyase/homocysteine desulfhydrase